MSNLERFPRDEVAPIANLLVGKIESDLGVSESHHWLCDKPKQLDIERLTERLHDWRRMTPFQVAELIHLLHAYGRDSVLAKMASDGDMYTAVGPKFVSGESYSSQAPIALL